MIAGIWSVIQLILELIGLWKRADEYSRDKAVADREERRQDRDKAVDAQTAAQTDEEFDREQDTIAHNMPKP